jgi:hypothetical protein
MKTLIYIMVSAAEDEETQRRGVVLINYFIGPLSIILDPVTVTEGAALMHWVPLRIAGIHQCLNDPLLRAVASLLLLGAGRDRRARVRVHGGMCQFPIFPFLTLHRASHYLLLLYYDRHTSRMSVQYHDIWSTHSVLTSHL